MKITKTLCVLFACAIGICMVFPASITAAAGHACCAGPVAHAESKPDPAPKKSEAAGIEEQKKNYPLDVCVVLGNKLGEHGEVVDYVYKGRLVRFCCKGCIATFEKDLAKYLAKLDEAAKSKAKAETSSPKSTGEADQGSHTEHSHH